MPTNKMNDKEKNLSFTHYMEIDLGTIVVEQKQLCRIPNELFIISETPFNGYPP